MKDEDIKLFMMNSGEIIVAEIVDFGVEPVSYTHLTLPTTPYV